MSYCTELSQMDRKTFLQRRKRDSFSIHFLLFVFFICIFVYGEIFAWGFQAHKLITKTAVQTLPVELRSFFLEHEAYLAEHSVDPDLWRKDDKDEAIRHYIDIDLYGNYPFKELPRSFEEAKQKFGEDTVLKRGIIPWWIVVRFDRLVSSMQSGDREAILEDAAALCHYVSDIHVPLHTIENYDGQLTGNDGIHSRFEDTMIEAHADSFKIETGQAHFIEEPLTFTFDIILDSYLLAERILRADTEAKQPGKEYHESEDYDEAYFNSLFEKLGPIAQAQMSNAAVNVGSFWYTAWVKAGKPSLPENH